MHYMEIYSTCLLEVLVFSYLTDYFKSILGQWSSMQIEINYYTT